MSLGKTVEFVGVPSGDHECFCWAVDRETFLRLTGEQPSAKGYDDSPFHPGLFKLYPGFELPDGGGVRWVRYRITTAVVPGEVPVREWAEGGGG